MRSKKLQFDGVVCPQSTQTKRKSPCDGEHLRHIKQSLSALATQSQLEYVLQDEDPKCPAWTTKFTSSIRPEVVSLTTTPRIRQKALQSKKRNSKMLLDSATLYLERYVRDLGESQLASLLNISQATTTNRPANLSAA